MLQSFWILGATFMTVATYASVKMAPDEVSFADVFLVRSAFMFVCITVLIGLRGVRLRADCWRLHSLRCCTGIAALILNIVTVRHIPIAAAQTLAYTAPLFIAAYTVIRRVIGRQPANFGLIGAIVLGFVGVCFTLRPSFDDEMAAYGIFALLSAICAAISALTLRRLGELREPALATIFFFACGCLTTAILIWPTFSTLSLGEIFSMPELLAVGAFTMGAQFSQTLGWGHGKTLLCANLQFSAIIFSVLFGALLFDETFDMDTTLGISTILAAEILATIMQLRAKSKAE